MSKKIKTATLVLISLVIIGISGCSSMFAHIFGSDHIKEKMYRFLLFNSDKSSILYGGYLEIKKVESDKFSGEFKIIDVFSESIPIASGVLEGTEYDDRDKASMTFKGKLSEDTISINLDKTWNLLEGTWSYKSLTGKFVAFDYN